jgi:hypothetical protein
MAKDPAVLWYTSDFLTGTILFTDEQVGQYSRLLCHQHQLGHLPEQHMLNICKTHDSPVWKKFTKDENGFWYQHRMEIEIKKRASYCESRRSNKMKEYEKPKHMSKHMSGHMEDEDEDGNRIKDGSEKSPEKEGNAKGRENQYPADFLSFWKEYPKKVGKGEAVKVWKREKPVLEKIIQALNWQKKDAQWISEGGKYIPHPATYLNQRRWEDETGEPVGTLKIGAINYH